MSNIDPHEIHQFSQHAKDWWNPTGPYKALHMINPTRLAFIQQHVELKNKCVLDIGCGGGLVAEAVAKCGAHVTGIDMDDAAITTATAHAKEHSLNINYQTMTAESLAEKQANRFDVITCLEMLEHVPEPESILRACSILLKSGGYVFFSTLNRNLLSYLGAIVAAEYILNIVPRGTHQYQRFIKPAELDNWARPHGLELKQLQGIHYNPLTDHSKLTDRISINYIACYHL